MYLTTNVLGKKTLKSGTISIPMIKSDADLGEVLNTFKDFIVASLIKSVKKGEARKKVNVRSSMYLEAHTADFM